MGQKIMVGMSGGVDSSVAACLLLRQGYDVTGVTFKLWDDPAGDSGCCSADDVRDAAFVCEQLGIPHYVINYKELFREKVVAPFAEEYLHGRTPNPCINCNRYIKFGAFSHKLKELGFDLMATGHYARCGYNDATGRWELRRGIYPEKDQSYVLCHLTQEQLAMLRLPLGEYSKPQIRAIAEESGLVVAKKPDSQDICFVPDGDYARVIRTLTGRDPQPGPFVHTETGEVLGTHRGQLHYTIGQRKGLGIAYAYPLFVIRKDLERNIVYVGPQDALFHRTLVAKDCNLIAVASLPEPLTVTAKPRYRAKDVPATIRDLGGGRIAVTFAEPQRALTPGQAIVFYQGKTVVGGGTIDTVGEEAAGPGMEDVRRAPWTATEERQKRI